MPRFSAGLRLGRYELVAPLGAGGMGEVYRARDTGIGREVAIKVLLEGPEHTAEQLARFEREARAVGALQHPNILVLHDLGSHEGHPYLVTELLLGRTLRDLLEKGPLPPRRVAEVGAQIASGLAAAHEKGIIHRDLKPENILLTDAGHVKILDFGLAKLAPGERWQGERTLREGVDTAQGAIVGTLRYLSPEQARGEPVDARTDQFALGAVLYEMLTGEASFPGATAAETLSAILRDEPAPLASRSPRAPPPLRWIVERCLAKDPGQRYSATRDLQHGLEAVASKWSELLSTANLEAMPSAGSPPRLQPVLLLAAVLLGIVLGITGTRWLSKPPPTDAPTLTYLTSSGRDSDPAVAPNGDTIAFASDRDGVSRIWLQQLASGGEAPLTAGPDRLPRFSPDGANVLYVHEEATGRSLYRIALLGGEPHKILAGIGDADWSPDGRQIALVRGSAAASGSSLAVARIDGSQIREVYRSSDRNLFSPRFSPDGTEIAVLANSQSGTAAQIVLVRAAGGAARTLGVALPNAAVSSLAWSGSGKELYYLQATSVAAGNGGTGALLQRIDIASARTTIAAWAPGLGVIGGILGAGQVVFGSFVAHQSLWQAQLAPTPQPAQALSRGFAGDRQPVYSPDGRWLAFSSTRSGNLDLWEIDLADGAMRRLTDHPADDWDPAFTRDGKLLWSSNRSGAFELWTAEPDGSQPRQVTHEQGDAENPTATPDGWIVYNSSTAGRSGVWKVRPDGSQATQLVRGLTNTPEVSPDGAYVAYRVDWGTSPRLMVARVADGGPVPFQVQLSAGDFFSVGRARWLPDGHAIAFVGPDGRGIFVQEFEPGRDTLSTRRLLVALDPATLDESFGISPDGRTIAVARLERSATILVANHVQGAEPSHH
jgi:eukaryotic-like serine/threonine-protein kinase